MEGEYDHLPEQAFYMVGSIEEAVEKAKNFNALIGGDMAMTYHTDVVSAEQQMFSGLVEKIR